MNIKTILFLCCALLISACQKGNVISYENAAQIQRNITTEAEVRQIFGEPTAVHTNMQRGTRTLLYTYHQSDEIKKPLFGILGVAAGAALGSQIGGGFGQDLATFVGGAAGGAIASNAATTREHNRSLRVTISLQTGRVVDYQYTEDAYRNPGWRPSTMPSTL